MESCLRDIHLDWCIIYLDDIIIFFTNYSRTYSKAEAFSKKLWVAGLKLKPSNCEFFQTWISYLGHIVSKECIQTDPKKISASCDWPQRLKFEVSMDLQIIIESSYKTTEYINI